MRKVGEWVPGVSVIIAVGDVIVNPNGENTISVVLSVGGPITKAAGRVADVLKAKRRTEGAGRPALRDDPYSPANVNRRQSETRDNMGLNRDPDTPIPDQRPGRDMGGHEARGRIT